MFDSGAVKTSDTAGVASRMAARLIDLVVVILIADGLAFAPVIGSLPGLLVIVYFAYEIGPPAFGRQTPGKWMLRLRLENEAGRRASLGQLLVRALLLPLNLVAGTLVLLFSAQIEGGGSVPAVRLPTDAITHTRVVSLIARSQRKAPRWAPLGAVTGLAVAGFGGIFIAVGVAQAGDVARLRTAGPCAGTEMGDPPTCYLDADGVITAVGHIPADDSSEYWDVTVSAAGNTYEQFIFDRAAARLQPGEQVRVRVFGQYLLRLDTPDADHWDWGGPNPSTILIGAGIAALALAFSGLSLYLLIRSG